MRNKYCTKEQRDYISKLSKDQIEKVKTWISKRNIQAPKIFNKPQDFSLESVPFDIMILLCQ